MERYPIMIKYKKFLNEFDGKITRTRLLLNMKITRDNNLNVDFKKVDHWHTVSYLKLLITFNFLKICRSFLFSFLHYILRLIWPSLSDLLRGILLCKGVITTQATHEENSPSLRDTPARRWVRTRNKDKMEYSSYRPTTVLALGATGA
jgi:hypothetical protein